MLSKNRKSLFIYSLVIHKKAEIESKKYFNQETLKYKFKIVVRLIAK